MVDNSYQSLQPCDLAILFGAKEEEIIDFCGEKLALFDLSYRKSGQAERDNILLQVLERIDSANLTAAGEHRKSDWEDGWQQNLDEFVGSEYDLKALIPKYFHKSVPCRLFKEYVITKSPDFVYNVTDLFRTWIFQKFLSNFDCIYEFGCGTGHNLVCFAQIFPSKQFWGFDWASSSQKILEIVAKRYKWHLIGRNFDFFNPPDSNFHVSHSSAFFTLGALEQVGSRYWPFLDFVLNQKPEICINVECLHELYDRNCLTDYVALKYHRKRNYLEGYLSKLKELETQDLIEIIKIHRQAFGNLYDDPHSYVIWRPK